MPKFSKFSSSRTGEVLVSDVLNEAEAADMVSCFCKPPCADYCPPLVSARLKSQFMSVSLLPVSTLFKRGAGKARLQILNLDFPPSTSFQGYRICYRARMGSDGRCNAEKKSSMPPSRSNRAALARLSDPPPPRAQAKLPRPKSNATTAKSN